MTGHYDAIVVGAGTIGASAAHFLKKKGLQRVLLLDRGGAASGGTGKSAAIVRSFYTVPVMARLAREAVRLFHGLEEEGGSGHAFKTGPIFARELVDWIVDGTVRDDYRRFSYDRITDGTPFTQSFGGNRV